MRMNYYMRNVSVAGGMGVIPLGCLQCFAMLVPSGKVMQSNMKDCMKGSVESMKANIKRMAPIAILAFALSAIVAIPAVAGSYGFQGYLPAFGGHVSLQSGYKDSSSSTSAYTWVDGIFWIDRSGYGQVTNGYTIYPGGGATMPYYDSSWWTGYATLRGAQPLWGPGTDFVSGGVNFG